MLYLLPVCLKFVIKLLAEVDKFLLQHRHQVLLDLGLCFIHLPSQLLRQLCNSEVHHLLYLLHGHFVIAEQN